MGNKVWLEGETDHQMKKFRQGFVKCLDKMKLEHLIHNPALTSLPLRITCLLIIRCSIKHNDEISDIEI